jgi:hypothetical protein
MASTTEELTTQSDQLTSAIGFFRTGDAEGVSRAAVRPAAASPAARTASWNAEASAPARPKNSKPNGVNIKLKDKTDGLDDDFERF